MELGLSSRRRDGLSCAGGSDDKNGMSVVPFRRWKDKINFFRVVISQK